MKMRRYIITLATLLVLSLSFVPLTSAQVVESSLGITAIPARLGDDGSLSVKPGETIRTQVRVRNTNAQSIQVGTIIEDFIIGDDGRTPVPVIGKNDSRWSLASWMQLSDTNQEIPAGGSQTITVTIQVPDSALPGGRYAMIMHEPRLTGEAGEQNGTTAGQTGISQRVGTLIYLRVAGEVKEEAFLRNITIPPFQEYGPVPIKFSVENLSDIHITPTATIVIRNMFGVERARISVPAQNIFPYTMREFSSSWERVWGAGRYTAEVFVEYGESHSVIAEEFSFWLLPIKLILILLTLFLAMIGLIVFVVRHIRRRSNAKHKDVELLEHTLHQLENTMKDKQ
jgi:hypothetical protein